MNRDERIVVAGGGLTALRAAERLRELKFEGEITILGDEKLPPYHRPALSKQLLQGALRPSDLTLPAYEDLNARWRFGTQVRQLIPGKKTLVLPGGEEMTYDGLIIATGVEATRQNGVPYHDPRVMVLRTMSDGLDLERVLGSTKGRVAVIGGGFTGCELAASLRHLSREVTLIGRGKNLLGNVLGPDLGEWLTNMHRDHGVDLALGNSVEEWAPGTDGIGLRLTDGSRLTVSCVILAAGTKPMTHWLRGSGLPLDNGVVCEPTCHVVGAEDVVAAGDVAQWPNLRFDNVPRRVEHWLNAVEMGRAAAESLLAGREKAEPFCPMPRFWTDQYSARIQAAGMLKLGKDIVQLGTPDEGTGTVYGFSAEGRLMGVVGVDCPSAMIAWADSVSRQNPEPRPRVEAGTPARPAVNAGATTFGKKRPGKHVAPPQDKQFPKEERREHQIAFVEDPVEVSGPIGVGAGRVPNHGRPKNVVDSFSRMLPVAVRPPTPTGPPAPIGPPHSGGLSNPGGPSNPFGSPNLAGSPHAGGPSSPVGSPNPLGPSNLAGSAHLGGPSSSVGPSNPGGVSGSFGSPNLAGSPYSGGPSSSVGSPNPAGSPHSSGLPNSAGLPNVAGVSDPVGSPPARLPASVSPSPGSRPIGGRTMPVTGPIGGIAAGPVGAPPLGPVNTHSRDAASVSGAFPVGHPRPDGVPPHGRLALGPGLGQAPKHDRPPVPDFTAAEMTDIGVGMPEPLAGRLGPDSGLAIDVTGQMALLDADGHVRTPDVPPGLGPADSFRALPPASVEASFGSMPPARGPQDSFRALPPATDPEVPPTHRGANGPLESFSALPPAGQSPELSSGSLPPARRGVNGPQNSFGGLPPVGHGPEVSSGSLSPTHRGANRPLDSFSALQSVGHGPEASSGALPPARRGANGVSVARGAQDSFGELSPSRRAANGSGDARGVQDSFSALPPARRAGASSTGLSPVRRSEASGLAPARRAANGSAAVPGAQDSFSALPPARRANGAAAHIASETTSAIPPVIDADATYVPGSTVGPHTTPAVSQTDVRRAAHRAEDLTPEFGRPPKRRNAGSGGQRRVPALSSMDDSIEMPAVRVPRHGRPEDYGVPAARGGPEDSYDHMPAVERPRASGGRRRARA